MQLEDPKARAEFYLRLLYWALLEVRLAGWDGKAERCASIADAFHNLPGLVAALVEGRDVTEEEEALVRALAREAASAGWSDELQAWQRYAAEPREEPE